METKDLIANYSVGGDMFLIVLCIVIMAILLMNFVSSNKGQTLLIVSNIFLFLASLSNLCFYYSIKFELNPIHIYIFRDAYHVLLLSIFVIYVGYVNQLADTPQRISRILGSLSGAIALCACIADCLSPITHFGFYMISDGLWSDPTFLKPFTIAYILEMTILGANVLFAGKRIIKSIRQLLMFTFFLCITVSLIESTFSSNTLMAMTFALPIIVVLFELHSSPYNLLNGARDFAVLGDYIVGRYSAGRKDTYMCLQLYPEEGMEFPRELGKAFYSFYDAKFKHAKLFANGLSTYVLVIPEDIERNIEEKVSDLVKVAFARQYDKYGIDYKIAILTDEEFDSFDAFNNCLRYWMQATDTNSCKDVRSSEMEQYRQSIEISAQLQNINEKKDLNDERVLAYCQPVKNINTGKYDTAEALMRLNLPKYGIIYPDVFIPIAENLGYIHTLSLIILNKTCREIKKMESEGFSITRISVNFTIPEMIAEGFIDDFKRVVDSNGVKYSQIGVELTESRDDKDYDKLFNVVMQLRELGAMIYLDDFGTGYSNFDRILKLKFDLIKLDRSLLLMADERDEADADKKIDKGNYDNSMLLAWFTKSFVSMGYKVLCEGVENDEQEKRCTSYGMMYLQGYKYSRPIPIENMRNFFTA